MCYKINVEHLRFLERKNFRILLSTLYTLTFLILLDTLLLKNSLFKLSDP